jgi:hypothetical protein
MLSKEELIEKWSPVIQKVDSLNSVVGTTEKQIGWLCEYAERHSEIEQQLNERYSESNSQVGVSLLAVALKIGLGIKRASECKINFEGVAESHSIVYDFSPEETANIADPISGQEIIQYAEKVLVNKAIDYINSRISEVKLKSSPGDQVEFNVGTLAKQISVITEKGLNPRLILNLEVKIESPSYNQLLLEEKQLMGSSDSERMFLESFKNNIERAVLEESKEYYWLRLYLREECEIENGEVLRLRYAPTEESIDLIFIAYEKKGQTDQFFSDIIEYVKEDDKKILCLMLDIKEVNTRTDIGTLQKLLRCSRVHEDTMLRRQDLLFERKTENNDWAPLDYYDADF